MLAIYFFEREKHFFVVDEEEWLLGGGRGGVGWGRGGEGKGMSKEKGLGGFFFENKKKC